VKLLSTGNFNSYVPNLTGTGASGTWNINISGSASAVSGYGVSVSPAANTIALRDANGYVYGSYLNQSSGNNESVSISQVMVTNGSDNFLRKTSIAAIAPALSGTAPINITGTSQLAHTLGQSGGSTGMTFNWSGQAGQPTWLWGGSDGVNMYVYNPSNFNVSYANSAGSTGVLTGPAHTNGADGWFRSNGQTGWYNETYAVGIYATDTTYVRTYNGASLYTNSLYATGDVTAYSDKRVKTEITVIPNALEKVEALRGVTYIRTDNGDLETGKRSTGVIAQEVLEVLPEAVKLDKDDPENGMMAVAYGNMVGLLIESIKELSAQNKALLARVEALEAK
jgi:hypothetical protein